MPTSTSALSFNQSVIEEFRANGGRVGGPFEGGDLLLLTTTGARSGRPHTVPLGYVRGDGGELLVVASAAGAPHHPAWYHNLLAHPLVAVELGTLEFEAVAVPAEGARRERLFAAVVRAEPGYGEYQERTERQLPVVILQPPAGGTLPEPGPAADAGAAGTGNAGAGAADAGGGTAEVSTLADKVVEVHTWLRAQLRHVRAEADAWFAERAASALPDGASGGSGAVANAPSLGLQLRQHCLAFCESLAVHHAGEDAAVFPALARSHPELRDTLDRLAEEHRTVSRLRGELTALLAGLTVAEPERFRSELARMSEELEAHLDHEERTLLPALAEIPFPPRR